MAGLTSSGADAYLLHVTTMPSVVYIVRVDDFDCGIMISASHNSYYDNGSSWNIVKSVFDALGADTYVINNQLNGLNINNNAGSTHIEVCRCLW